MVHEINLTIERASWKYTNISTIFRDEHWQEKAPQENGNNKRNIPKIKSINK